MTPLVLLFYNLPHKYLDKAITKHRIITKAGLVRDVLRYQKPNLIGAVSNLSFIITYAELIIRKRKKTIPARCKLSKIDLNDIYLIYKIN